MSNADFNVIEYMATYDLEAEGRKIANQINQEFADGATSVSFDRMGDIAAWNVIKAFQEKNGICND